MAAWEGNGVILHEADCRTVLAGMAADSVDAIVTDPPYGLADHAPATIVQALTAWTSGDRDHVPDGRGFMGRDWDRFVPPPAVWDECLRVLKPGGHLVAFAGSRTIDLMGLSIRLAGFELRDSLHWVFGQGFPKSLDVSKAIDRLRDDKAEVRRVTAWLAAARDAAGVSNRQIDEAFGFNGMAGHWTSAQSQASVPTPEQWERLRELLSFGPEMDAEVWRLNARKGTPGPAWADRQPLGPLPWGRKEKHGSVALGGGWQDNPMITASATDDARRWEGWGTGLKPAHEPIVLARRPLAGTVAASVLTYGTGALNIDACRVGGPPPSVSPPAFNGPTDRTYTTRTGVGRSGEMSQGMTGRWPTNVLFTHGAQCAEDGPCAEGCPVRELDRQSGTLTSGANPTRRGTDQIRDTYGEFTGQAACPAPRGKDTGAASRFFPVFRYESKAPGSERPRLADGTAWPTVKPLALMRWLVRLVTPPGGLVVDPFAGTGTTGQACALEGVRCVLAERDPVAVELARVRLGEAVQPELFAAGE